MSFTMLSKTISSTLRHLKLYHLHCNVCSQFHSNARLLTNIKSPATKNFPLPRTAQYTNEFVQSRLDTDDTGKPHNDEKLYIISQNDPDVFGGVHKSPNDETIDEGDAAEEKYLENPPTKSQKLSTKQYADMIKDHFRNNRIKEAIDVVEVRMLKEDRVKPENYIFNLLIGGCSRVGYSKKAFSLYNKMKQRNLKVTGGTYTSLFNACATAPWPQDGLNKANHLREIMIDKGYSPNESNYNAMIKAYGRCGDIKTAFQLVDEMKFKNLNINVETFNFLLHACASDKEYGFRHALLVWHKMLRRNLLPDIYSFNLLLRCVRDCGMGDLETTEQVIKEILLKSQQKPELQSKQEDKILTSGENVSNLSSGPLNTHVPDIATACDESPNLLTKYPHLGSLVALKEIQKPEDRLLLLGGLSGFLLEMEKVKVIPNIKTFTELIDVVPSTLAAEKKVIINLRKLAIKCDIDFFNMLIKKRSMRFDYDGAKAVLSLIKTAALHPDIVTYGVLSLGCKTQEDAKELLQEMYDKGIRINIQILGAMLKQGCVGHNFNYITEIMKIVKTERIKPNEQFLNHIDLFHNKCYNMIRNKNKIVDETFKEDLRNFKNFLEKWKTFMGLNNMKLEEAVNTVREHPWEQFKYSQPEGMEDVKNLKKRHKKKLARHIQRIKPEKMIDGSTDVKVTAAKATDVKKNSSDKCVN